VLGFFSFTEITDASAHAAYNAWHQLDHLPEQFSIDGVTFGERWVRSPRCQAAEAATSTLLERFHYMTLYLLRDESVLQPFFDLAIRLRAEDRFFSERHALLSGPFEVTGRWAAPRVAVSAAVIPHRPAQGVYVVVGPPVDGGRVVAQPGVAGAWQFADHPGGRHVTVAFVDGDLWAAAVLLGPLSVADALPEWAGPLERVDASRWDWFATLTAQ
jgi:hypothetical protein